MRHPSTFAAATLAAAGLAFAGCGSSSSKTEANGYPAATSASQKAAAATSSASGSTATGTAVTTVHTNLGTVLAAGPKRLTVYLFAADTGPASTCSGACAQVWPPVSTSGAPKAEGSAVSADLGTITRADGTKQLTYKGHPLYYYVSDSQSGETTGQGINSFGAAWYVMSPQGSKIDNS